MIVNISMVSDGIQPLTGTEDMSKTLMKKAYSWEEMPQTLTTDFVI